MIKPEYTQKRDAGYTNWIKEIGRYPDVVDESVNAYSHWNRNSCGRHCYMMDIDHLICMNGKDKGGVFVYSQFQSGKVSAIVEAKKRGYGFISDFQYHTYLYMADMLDVPFYVVEYDTKDETIFWVSPKDKRAKARFGEKKFVISRDMWKQYIETEVCKW